MKILVTGGAGFIGSHIVDAYIELGHEVVIVDNLSTGNIANINPKATFYKADIRSEIVMDNIFKMERPNAVNHHAAQKSVNNSISNPLYDAELNVLGTINLLELSSKYGVEKFIAASSGGALAGDATRSPTTENYSNRMETPYAISKHTMENYISYYCKNTPMNCICLRYANVYGPRQDGSGESGVVSIFLKNAMENKKSTMYTHDNLILGCVRDYVYVSDVVRANIYALTSCYDGIVNIGTAMGTSTSELYSIICKATGCKLNLEVGKSKPGDVKRSVLEYSKAYNVLGWVPLINVILGVGLTYGYMKGK